MRAIWAGALLVVYLTASGILLAVGFDRVSWRALAVHAALLGGVATATWYRRAPSWLRAWAPLIVLVVLYSELPSLIRAAGHQRLLDDVVIGWEQAVFRSQPARVWATRWPSVALSELLHAAYLSYYAIIVSVPAFLYVSGRRREFAEAMAVLMLTFVVCFAAYIVFPVAGPRYLWTPRGALAGPIRTATIWLLEARSSRGTAFPSSHVAVATTQSILAVRYFGARRGAAVGVVSVALALGAVYGGFHYAIDVLAGTLVGIATTIVGLGLVRRLDAWDQAKASAPT